MDVYDGNSNGQIESDDNCWYDRMPPALKVVIQETLHELVESTCSLIQSQINTRKTAELKDQEVPSGERLLPGVTFEVLPYRNSCRIKEADVFKKSASDCTPDYTEGFVNDPLNKVEDSKILTIDDETYVSLNQIVSVSQETKKVHERIDESSDFQCGLLYSQGQPLVSQGVPTDNVQTSGSQTLWQPDESANVVPQGICVSSSLISEVSDGNERSDTEKSVFQRVITSSYFVQDQMRKLHGLRLADAQTSVPQEMWTSEAQTAISQGFGQVNVQTSVSQEMWTSEAQTTMSQSFGKIDAQTSVPQEMWTSEAQTAISQGFGQVDVQTSVSQEMWTSEAQTTMSQRFGLVDAQTSMSQEIWTSEAQTATSQGFGKVDAQTSVQQEMWTSEAQTAISQGFGHVDAQTSVTQEIWTSEAQSAASLSFGKVDAQTSVSQGFGKMDAQTSISQKVLVSDAQTTILAGVVVPNNPKAFLQNGVHEHKKPWVDSDETSSKKEPTPNGGGKKPATFENKENMILISQPTDKLDKGGNTCSNLSIQPQRSTSNILRLGLSKNFRALKPLHPLVKMSHYSLGDDE